MLSTPDDFAMRLADLRVAAKMKQDELGKAVGLDGSTISRYETSDLVPGPADAQQLFRAIKTKEAKAYCGYLGQEWEYLRRPQFDHPQRDALWRAEHTLKRIHQLLADPDMTEANRTNAKSFRSALERECAYLQDLCHDVPFIGEIAVGKTTALSVGVGLLLEPSPDERSIKRTVMEVGAGNTTICEVVVHHDPGRYGLTITPCSEDEIVLYVNDLCAGVLTSCSDLEDGERRGVPREIERALRNMSSLQKRIEKTPDGKSRRLDPILESPAASSLATLALGVLQKLELAQRTKTEWWYEPGCDLEPLTWLRKTFSEVNSGRERYASLPKSITVVAPLPLSQSPYRLRFIDTRGIEGEITDRPDLAAYLEDPRAVPILCSSFYRALDGSVENLLRSAREAGVRESVEMRSVILVLPQNDQALQVLNDSGDKPESYEEGYDNKRDKVRTRLDQWGYPRVPDLMFNADTDEPQDLLKAVLDRIDGLRCKHAERIAETADAVNDLFEEAAQAGVARAYPKVHAPLNTLYNKFRAFPGARVSPHTKLITVIESAHPRTVWASVRRQGSWYNLDFYHHLGIGVNTQAQGHYQGPFHELGSALGLMLSDDELKPVHGFLKEAIKNVEHCRAEFLKAASQLGNDAFRPVLKEARSLWGSCASECGRGYRNRVAAHVREWFEQPEQAGILEFIEFRLGELWRTWFLDNLHTLLDSSRPDSAKTKKAPTQESGK